MRSVAGGLLVQDRDNGVLEEGAFKVVTKRAPTSREMADLKFAWAVAKHVKSNAIVYAKDGVTIGIGAGQMSRVDSARLAARKAEEAAEMAGLPEPSPGARSSPPTPSFRSPTAWSRRSKPERQLSSSLEDRSATPR